VHVIEYSASKILHELKIGISALEIQGWIHAPPVYEFDFSKAFDKVNHRCLILKLKLINRRIGL